MRHKKLSGIKLNDVVYIITQDRWDRVVYIDDHVHGNFCMASGGRFYRKDLSF